MVQSFGLEACFDFRGSVCQASGTFITREVGGPLCISFLLAIATLGSRYSVSVWSGWWKSQEVRICGKEKKEVATQRRDLGYSKSFVCWDFPSGKTVSSV